MIYIPGGSKNRKTMRHEVEPTEAQARNFCNMVAAQLFNTYPNYHWEVGLNGNKAVIKNSTLNYKMGYQFHVSKVDPEGRFVRRVGGEILERYNVRRGRGVLSEVELLKRDILDNCTPEL